MAEIYRHYFTFGGCKKAERFWRTIRKTINKILNTNLENKPDIYLLNMLNDELEKK